MKRRNFLGAGLVLPAAAIARTTGTPTPGEPPALVPAEKSPTMRFRTIGKTGLKVTEVGFGCMITSDQSVVEKAYDIGITYFDTARGYQGGNNEKMVGAALKGNKRKKIVLSSKSGARTKDEALDQLNTSLQTLGTDYLDIWYLHAKTTPDQLTDDLMEAQRIAKKQGKIRFAGVSTHGGQPALIPAVIKAKHFDVVLTSYNFTMATELDALIKNLKDAGIGVVAMKVMAGGFRRAKPGEKLYTTLKRDGAMLAALKWALKNPNVDTTIPSMTDMDQLDDNLKAMTQKFSDADNQLLTAYLERISPMYCRMCGSCEGKCPKGLPVADMLRYVMYADGYGQFALGREQFQTLPDEVAAVRCGDCESCSIQCPNGVNVAGRLSRAQELFA